jgi:hypothetical protein
MKIQLSEKRMFTESTWQLTVTLFEDYHEENLAKSQKYARKLFSSKFHSNTDCSRQAGILIERLKIQIGPR